MSQFYHVFFICMKDITSLSSKNNSNRTNEDCFLSTTIFLIHNTTVYKTYFSSKGDQFVIQMALQKLTIFHSILAKTEEKFSQFPYFHFMLILQ